MIQIIAHRGNLNGPCPEKENHPDQILLCIEQGFDCEIDVWYHEELGWWLGHDKPQYSISLDFLRKHATKLWCHCKHLYSLVELLKYPEIQCFYHQTDDYTLTSHGNIWVYPGKKVPNDKGILVMPLESTNEISREFKGICTDYPMKVKE